MIGDVKVCAVCVVYLCLLVLCEYDSRCTISILCGLSVCLHDKAKPSQNGLSDGHSRCTITLCPYSRVPSLPGPNQRPDLFLRTHIILLLLQMECPWSEMS